MLRPATSLFALAIALAAALPGAAVFARAQAAACPEFRPIDAARVARFPLVVVGTVESVDDAKATIATEAILKGSAQGARLNLAKQPGGDECPVASLDKGQRVFLLLAVEGGVPGWPHTQDAYYLESGRARSADPTAGTPFLERDLVDLVREQSAQVVVPAESADEGEGIEWGSTVLPIAVALGVVFIIGLFLMRIWHRIDPT